MTYHLLRMGLRRKEMIDLTHDEYVRIRGAVFGLFRALSIEEKLALVMDNYLEFEVELQQLTTENLLKRSFAWGPYRHYLNRINRRVANLLSAGRLYIDQVKYEISRLYGKESEKYRALESSLSAQYDQHLGYRVLEALRNFVQHQSLPIYHLSFPAIVDDKDGNRLIRYNCTPSLSVAWLRTQGGFKSAILDELESSDEDLVDIKPFIREYVDCLSIVHQDLRASMRDDIVVWEATHADSMIRWSRDFVKEIGLAVAMLNERGLIVEKAAIFKEVVQRRQELEQQFPSGINLHRSYVSSISEGDSQ